MNGSPSSLPGCAGYFNRYQEICVKVFPRVEVKSLLQQILDVIGKEALNREPARD